MQSALFLCFVAFPDGEPVSTSPGNALIVKLMKAVVKKNNAPLTPHFPDESWGHGGGRRAGYLNCNGADLCRKPNGLVYVLTALARDGKVSRATVDTASGKVLDAR